MTVAPARGCAYGVVRRVFEEGAYADLALHSAAADLNPRDRALATALVYGTVQRRRTLDHVLARLVSRPLETVDAPVLAALRLGAHQLLLMGGITDYAAVNDSVELVKRSSPGGAKFVNAVLRRLAREGPKLLSELDDATVEGAAVLHSVPDWIAEMWWDELGEEDARGLLRSVNLPAENAIRVNLLRADGPGTLAAALPATAAPRGAQPWTEQPDLPELPEALVLEGPFDTFGSEQWNRGEIMPQSRGSMVVSRVLEPQPGERVLDLCAAPGGKTTHLAALMDGEGELVAVEVNPGRARALAETCTRMGAANVRVVNEDGRSLDPALRAFDRVLVDPPCSGLGTMQIRPDLRWQPRRGQLDALSSKQAELLAAGADRLDPGGTLVYSVCTISRREGVGQVERLLDDRPDFICEQRWQLLPHRDGTDGFFIARLKRA